jgi:hypothetical protein
VLSDCLASRESGLLVLVGLEDDPRLSEHLAWIRQAGPAGSEAVGSRRRICQIFLEEGAPSAISAERTEEELAAHVVRNGVVEREALARAMHDFPHRLPMSAVLAAEVLPPLQVTRQVSSFVLSRVLGAFSWAEGTFALYRGVRRPPDTFPTGRDALGFIVDGVSAMAPAALDRYVGGLVDRSLVASASAPVSAAQLDRHALVEPLHRLLARAHTMEQLLQESTGESAAPVKQAIHLLVECGLVLVI